MAVISFFGYKCRWLALIGTSRHAVQLKSHVETVVTVTMDGLGLIKKIIITDRCLTEN